MSYSEPNARPKSEPEVRSKNKVLNAKKNLAKPLPKKERTLALFLLLMCDWTLFEAVFGSPASTADFDPQPIFDKYSDLKIGDFTDAIADIKAAEDDLADARISWFNIVGADYTGSACPDVTSLKDLVVHIKL